MGKMEVRLRRSSGGSGGIKDGKKFERAANNPVQENALWVVNLAILLIKIFFSNTTKFKSSGDEWTFI